MIGKNKVEEITLFFIIYFAFLFLFFWKAPLYPPDEPKYTFAALKMLETGDYITPYFNCEDRLEKPIFTYWLLAISYKLFGVTDWSARLPFVLISLALLFILYKVAKKEVKGAATYVALLFFCTNLQIFVYSKAIVPENPLLFFNTLTTFLFYYGLKEERISLINYGYVSAGFAFLTKGPLALIIPMGINLPFFFFKKGFKAKLKRFLSPIGILFFIILSLVWYGPIIYIHRWDFINEFFILHNIKRFSGSANMHIYPFYYYLLILLISLYFWLPYLKNFIYYLVKTPKKTDFEKFLLWWVVFVFLFFSFSKNKLHHYIIIIYPALSMLIAISYERLKEGKVFSNVILIILIILEFSLIIFWKRLFEKIEYPINHLLLVSLVFSITLLVTNNLFSRFVSLVLNGLKFFLITMVVFFYIGERRKDIYNSLEYAREMVKGKKVYTYKRSAEDLNHYLSVCIERVQKKENLIKIIAKKEPFVLIIRERNLKEIEDLRYQKKLQVPNLKTLERYLISF